MTCCDGVKIRPAVPGDAEPLAEVAGALIGFASVGPPRDDDVTAGEELRALYVLASWWSSA